MSRYVDIDTLKIPSEEMIAKWIVNEAPSIDIVRCRECKYWNEDFILTCRRHISKVDADDFCSYGERKDQ